MGLYDPLDGADLKYYFRCIQLLLDTDYGFNVSVFELKSVSKESYISTFDSLRLIKIFYENQMMIDEYELLLKNVQ